MYTLTHTNTTIEMSVHVNKTLLAYIHELNRDTSNSIHTHIYARTLTRTANTLRLTAERWREIKNFSWRRKTEKSNKKINTYCVALTFAVCTPWHIQSLLAWSWYFFCSSTGCTLCWWWIISIGYNDAKIILSFPLSITLWNKIWINCECHFLATFYGDTRMCVWFSNFCVSNECVRACACVCTHTSAKITTEVEFRLLYIIYIIRLAPVL